jgi:CubicO group peptidase (beta-lactamase class C family)
MRILRILTVTAGLVLLQALLQAMPALASGPTLAERAAKARPDTGAPALGLVVASGDGKPDIAVDGVRVMDKPDAVTAGDRWHIGSMTKSMTSTMIGRLVDQGRLKFDSTLGELLPDIDMKPEYRAVTLEQVMQHRAGVPQLMRPEPEVNKLVNETLGTPIQKNAAFARWLLTQSPVAPPGTAMKYSNGGYGLLGYIAEKVTGVEYRVLMKREVFDTIGLASAGFGWPVDLGADQPRGHGPGPNGIAPAPDGYRLPPHLDPAGNVYLSLADLTRYMQAHLKGLQGKDGVLKAATVQRLHTPAPAAAGEMNYACGWGILAVPMVGTSHGHNGSAGTFYAEMAIVPERNLVAAVVTNAGPKRGEGPPAQAKLLRELLSANDFSVKAVAAAQ